MNNDLEADCPPLECLVIENTLVAAKEPERLILEAVEKHGFSNDATFAIRLGLEEALTNAIKHGNAGDPSKKITVKYYVGPDQFIVCIEDEGPGFRPARVPDCTDDARIGLPDGRGIMLMEAYLDDIRYSERGNKIRLIKKNN